ncbi:gamma carbonic anhydrase family protein [Polycladidibacter hongkongensis]|uniref:gamma carbonic anhydrase family protein n=1 Tax=Polycladidibacter hongkongensis TaxID=1647556 RepID=UPI000833DE32|nr:gamma carbonic anhydrase family protein [Pseudovibrio hongkongensis]
MPVYSLGRKQPQLPEADAFFIAPTATVIGDVLLEDNASIWFNAVVRGDRERISIGAGSNVQDGCVLHTDPGYPLIVGAGVTIGHNAVVHGCEIGEGSLIGMGATVLNGAKIGKGCLIGANALVTERTVIPDHSLVLGAPAKVKGTLDAAAQERLRLSALGYVANWQRYSKELDVFVPSAMAVTN